MEEAGDGQSQGDIKRQREAIEENEGVIRDILPKLMKTYGEVKNLLKSLQGQEEEDEELFQNAKEYLEAAAKFAREKK
jgi:DNA-directed RNA polymerase subunit F